MADGTDTGAATTTTDTGNGVGQQNTATQAGKTFTQDQVNDLIAREKGSFQSRYADYDDLRKKASEFDKLADAQKTQQQKDAEAKAALEARATSAEGKLLRLEIAAAKGLDAEWASRLTGSTKQELEADAEALAKKIGNGSTRTTFDGGVRSPAPANGGMDAAIRHRAGRA